jgi:hypothetical protein
MNQDKFSEPEWNGKTQKKQKPNSWFYLCVELKLRQLQFVFKNRNWREFVVKLKKPPDNGIH